MGWNSQSVFNLLIINASGGFTGLFTYSPAPGNGNLIASITGAAGTDPYGNAYLKGITSYGASGVINENGSTLLVYAPTAAAGNLIASMSASQTTDTFGNAILEAFAVYAQVGAPKTAARIQETGISYYTAATQAGPWTIQASVDYDPTLTALVVSAPLLDVFNALALSASGGAIFKVTETGGAPSSPPSQFIAHAAAERVLGIEVTGDAVFRMRIDSNGRHDWGDGTTTDTALYRAAANQLAADPIAFNSSGSAETWHTFAALGYQNSWVDGGPPDVAGQYRHDAAPYNTITLVGSLTVPIGAASGQTIVTLPAAYRPTNNQMVVARDKTGNKAVFLSVASTGVVAFQQTAGTVGTGDVLQFAGRIYLDA